MTRRGRLPAGAVDSASGLWLPTRRLAVPRGRLDSRRWMGGYPCCCARTEENCDCVGGIRFDVSEPAEPGDYPEIVLTLGGIADNGCDGCEFLNGDYVLAHYYSDVGGWPGICALCEPRTGSVCGGAVLRSGVGCRNRWTATIDIGRVCDGSGGISPTTWQCEAHYFWVEDVTGLWVHANPGLANPPNNRGWIEAWWYTEVAGRLLESTLADVDLGAMICTNDEATDCWDGTGCEYQCNFDAMTLTLNMA